MKHSLRYYFTAVLTVVVLVVLGIASPATATPTPSNGTADGGTSVTIEGIRFIQIESGDNHTLGLTSEGTVFAWGRNDYGQLGNGSTTNSNTPVQVKDIGGTGFLTGVTLIAAGGSHSIASTSTGIVAWGRNTSGQLGNNTTNNSSIPVQVLGVGGSGTIEPATAIAGGYFHSLAITSSGLYSWGENGWGQLGIGNQTDSPTPVQVLAEGTGAGYLNGVTDVSAGYLYSLALSSTGGVFAWGQNQENQLGNDAVVTTGSFRWRPVRVKNVSGTGDLTGVTKISAGYNFGLALIGSDVVAWGDNPYGQLGDNSTTRRARPVQVLDSSLTALTGVTAIDAGGHHAVAMTSSGLMSWGANAYGQLGDGTLVNHLTAVQVLGSISPSTPFSGATSVTAGYCRSTAITSPDVYSWGCNVSYGGLGDGTNVSKSLPSLSANFRPTTVTFGGVAGTSLSSSGSAISVVSPAGSAGVVNLVVSANVFGGTSPGDPTTTSWEAGTFTYDPALARTGSSNNFLLSLLAALALLVGMGLFLAFGSQKLR